MTAYEVAGHTRACPEHGQYIDAFALGCPCCAGADHTPREYAGPGDDARWERELRRRCAPATDPDPEDVYYDR